MVDFNPHAIHRRLSAEAETKAKTGAEPGFILAPGNIETVAKDQGDRGEPKVTAHLGDGKVVPGGGPDTISDPKHDEHQNRGRIVTDGPFQFPGWIPMDVTMNCSLPYASYEIPIPLDLNMDFCIDVMMGQDTIVFMFVRGARPISCRSRLILAESQDNEAGDEYTWSILSF